MTPDEIKRYLALPEEFRDSGLFHRDNTGGSDAIPSANIKQTLQAARLALSGEGREVRND